VVTIFDALLVKISDGRCHRPVEVPVASSLCRVRCCGHFGRRDTDLREVAQRLRLRHQLSWPRTPEGPFDLTAHPERPETHPTRDCTRKHNHAEEGKRSRSLLRHGRSSFRLILAASAQVQSRQERGLMLFCRLVPTSVAGALLVPEIISQLRSRRLVFLCIFLKDSTKLRRGSRKMRPVFARGKSIQPPQRPLRRVARVKQCSRAR
jgi:hypothetical protein